MNSNTMTMELSLTNMNTGGLNNLFMCDQLIVGKGVNIMGSTCLMACPGHQQQADSEICAITLEDGVKLDGAVSIMPGVTIGQDTVVARGSVVTQDLPCGVLASGVPAEVVCKLKQDS
jgi:maltose O-acetyltransferase